MPKLNPVKSLNKVVKSDGGVKQTMAKVAQSKPMQAAKNRTTK